VNRRQQCREYGYFGASAAGCANFVSGAAFLPVHGNILVHDVP